MVVKVKARAKLWPSYILRSSSSSPQVFHTVYCQCPVTCGGAEMSQPLRTYGIGHTEVLPIFAGQCYVESWKVRFCTLQDDFAWLYDQIRGIHQAPTATGRCYILDYVFREAIRMVGRAYYDKWLYTHFLLQPCHRHEVSQLH